jgi:membrane protease YdiL (CAAX protease family)
MGIFRRKKSGADKEDEPRLNIKWNAIDGLISIAVLIVLLVGIYFGTSKLLNVLNKEQLLNISGIDNLTFSILYGVQVLLMLGVVWFFAIYWRGASLRDLGLRYYSIIKTIWYSFISLIFVFLVSFLYAYLMNSIFGIEAPDSKIEELISSRNVSSNVLLVVTAVVAPFCEEVYFRGFLYSAFRKSMGVNTALFLSSLLFALAHMEIYSFIPIMAIGWVMAYIFEKTKSLFTVIFLHAVYNLILILILLGQIEMIKMY